MKSDKNAVLMESVYKKYIGNDRYALDNFSLKINKGEFFGLLGPNGSGKSTTISILVGLIKATKGKTSIFGKNAKSIKHKIGLVPQEVALYEDLTLRENMILFARLFGLRKNELKDQINFALSIAQLESVSHRKISSFSGGMKRRANIVIAILHKPDLLILDEPTVGVDPQSRNVIFKCLQKLNKKGVTMLYTTHYLEEAEKLCSRLAIMDMGKIKLKGTINELLNSGNKVDSLGELFLNLTGTEVRDF
ncbi:MAG TPA: ABC transporter ATP-binding protein [Victivallales bacterium]|nr:ABC transporter ATP-binding protein [Victivallales bacterium]